MNFYSLIFLLLTFNIYGQAPLNIKSYLENYQISKAAKDFYNGKFMATDDIRTFSIIDSLETKNNLTRPFYILVVSKIIDKADGALSESLGISCKNFIESHPDFLLEFLYSKNALVDKKFIDDWVNKIGSEFMIDCECQEQGITNSFQKALSKIKLDNNTKLKQFYKKIETFCH